MSAATTTTSCARLVRDPIFYRDLGVLVRPSRRLEFWPSPEMCLEEKANATVRFLLYAGVLLYAATFKPKYVALSWAAIAVLGLLYSQHQPADNKEGFNSSSAVLSEQTRPRTRENPFANVLHADPHADLPPPEWDEHEAAQATKLFRSKMYMDLTDLSGIQASERQFMQMPEQDMDAFMQFLMQKADVDVHALEDVRSTAPIKEAKIEPFAAPLQQMTVSRPPFPVSLENSLRTSSVSNDGRTTKLGLKWELESMGNYLQAAPLVSEDPAAAASVCSLIGRCGGGGAPTRGDRSASGELMYAPAIGREVQDDWRLDPGTGSRAKFGGTALINPASGMQQAAILADRQAAMTRVRQPFRSDDSPMLFNASSTREPLPVYGDSALRAPPFSHFRGDGTSLRGRPISMTNFSTYREPFYLKEQAPELTRFRGPTRTSQMLLNESIRPDIAQMIPLEAEPRAASTRLNDVVKEVEQTMDEAVQRAVGQAVQDVDAQSSIYATSMTHDGKKLSTEVQARAILPPAQPSMYRPVQAAAGGIATRFH